MAVIRVTNEQKKLITKLGFGLEFDRYTDDDWVDLEEAVADLLMQEGFDSEYNVLSIGTLCESILDLLGGAK